MLSPEDCYGVISIIVSYFVLQLVAESGYIIADKINDTQVLQYYRADIGNCPQGVD